MLSKNQIKAFRLPIFQAIVRAIAAERPEFVYHRQTNGDIIGGGGCSYHQCPTTTIPSRCIIGEALSVLGWSETALELIKGFAASELQVLGFSPEIVAWAQEVQSRQDNRIPWGECV